MTVLDSRQAIYDYCRSVFIKHHVDLVPAQHRVGSEIILVILQGHFTTSIPRTVTLDNWTDSRDGTFSRLYRLGHYRIEEVIEDEESIRYVALPVEDTAGEFGLLDDTDSLLMGKRQKGDTDIRWSSVHGYFCEIYSLETVVNRLNENRSPKNNELVTFIIEDVKEKLSPMVDTAPPLNHFWRDAFRHRLLWRMGHCSVFYGLPFLLVSWAAPSWVWTVVILLLADCYFSRKAMNTFINGNTQSLYRMVMHWKQVDDQFRQGMVSEDVWRLQATRVLSNVKVLPLAYLGRKQQEVYLDHVNDYLTLVSSTTLTTAQYADIGNHIHRMLTSYCIRSHY